jgi:hypothetical protein
MFERLKNILVSSYIGTIALGWIFAQGILHFAYIFSAPVVGWMTRREYRGLMEHATVTGFTLRDSLPELVKSLFSSGNRVLFVALAILRAARQAENRGNLVRAQDRPLLALFVDAIVARGSGTEVTWTL